MATLKDTVNKMVDQLSTFASEVTRVALEVGTEGILGGQAVVADVQGTWADLTRNVNVCGRLSCHVMPLTADMFTPFVCLILEHGDEFNEPGALHRGGDQGGGTGRPHQDGQCRRPGRDVGSQDDREFHGEAIGDVGAGGALLMTSCAF